MLFLSWISFAFYIYYNTAYREEKNMGAYILLLDGLLRGERFPHARSASVEAGGGGNLQQTKARNGLLSALTTSCHGHD